MKKLLLVLFLAIILCVAATAAADSLTLPTGFKVPASFDAVVPEKMLVNYNKSADYGNIVECYMGDYTLALFYSDDGQFQGGDIFWGWGSATAEESYIYNLLFTEDEARNLPGVGIFRGQVNGGDGYENYWDFNGNVKYVEYNMPMESGYRSYTWKPATNDGWYYEDVVNGEYKAVYEDIGVEKTTAAIPYVSISFTGEILAVWDGEDEPNNGGSGGPAQAADGNVVVLSDNLILSNVTCTFNAGADQWNEGSLGMLEINGEVAGPAGTAEVRIASWQDFMPTAAEAIESAESMVTVWKKDETSIEGRPCPFRFGGGRPVFASDAGKTQYTILAALDSSVNLVGYAVVRTEMPNAANQGGSGRNGLVQDADGVWRYYSNGTLITATGIIESGQNYYYVVNGELAAGANGLTYADGYWFLLSGGRVLNDYNGLYFDQNLGWWLIQGGVINFDYTGLYGDATFGWWLINGGAVNFGYTGLYYDAACGWWLIGGGQVCFDYNGVWDDPNLGPWVISGGQPVEPAKAGLNGLNCDADGVWRLYDNGAFASGYTGLYCDEKVGWWLVRNGEIAWDYTGLYFDANCGWWLIGGGHLANDYNGLWCDPVCGWWLIKDGTIDWGYTGGYDAFGATWNIVNGQLVF